MAAADMPQPANAPAPPQNSAECHKPLLLLLALAVDELAVVELNRFVLLFAVALVLVESLLLRRCCFVALSNVFIHLLPNGVVAVVVVVVEEQEEEKKDGELKKRRVMDLVLEVEVEVEVTLLRATRMMFRLTKREFAANIMFLFCVCHWYCRVIDWCWCWKSME